MILYHFTANQHIGKIREQGLTRGIFPHHIDESGRCVSISGYQWLTRESSYEQPWALLGNLPISKTSWRITVQIPRERERTLAHWPALVRRIQPQCAIAFNEVPGNSDWFVYKGKIPPHWFLAIERNFGDTMRPNILNGNDYG